MKKKIKIVLHFCAIFLTLNRLGNQSNWESVARAAVATTRDTVFCPLAVLRKGRRASEREREKRKAASTTHRESQTAARKKTL